MVTPFLPGDSLLFVAGTLAATGAMYVHGVLALLVLAAFSGDNTNSWIGFFVFGGYYFGNIPVVEQNLTLFILGIIVLSVMPGIVGFIRQKTRTEKQS
ncbi:MAG: hypothetical protein HY525_09580 [Betaproteobacteria bacterium]|nr:hypothetical protein [Betaproteobacteria bacterium]